MRKLARRRVLPARSFHVAFIVSRWHGGNHGLVAPHAFGNAPAAALLPVEITSMRRTVGVIHCSRIHGETSRRECLQLQASDRTEVLDIASEQSHPSIECSGGNQRIAHLQPVTQGQ